MTFVFRIGLFILLYSKIESPILLILYFIYELLKACKHHWILLCLLSLIYLRSSTSLPLFNIAIVTEIDDNEALIQEIFHQVLLYEADDLKEGDLIFYKAELYETHEKEYDYAGKYESSEYITSVFRLRALIKNHLLDYKEETQVYLKKFLYNDKDYKHLEDVFISGGFCAYLFLRYLKSNFKIQKRYYCLFILFYGALFSYEIQFLYFLLILFTDAYFEDSKEAFGCSLILLYFIKPNFLDYYALTIPILIRLFYILRKDLSPTAFLYILQSALFQGIEPIKTYLYPFFQKIYIFIWCSSLFLLIVPLFEDIYLKMIELMSLILGLFSFKIYGSFNLFCLFIIFVLIKIFKVKNEWLQSLIIITILILKLHTLAPAIHFIDVGQGDSILIRDHLNQHTILIDTGSKYSYYKLERFLHSLSIEEIDVLIISHNDEDHNGNLDVLKEDFNVRRIVTISSLIEEGPFRLEPIILNKEEDDNANSLVYYLKLNDYSFLFTGDLPIYKEKELMQKYGPIEVDVLKVGHHGSNTSSSIEFLKMLKPHFSIISTNGRYNHPSKETVSNLNAVLSKIYSTKDSRTISFYFTKVFDFIKTDNNEFDIIL